MKGTALLALSVLAAWWMTQPKTAKAKAEAALAAYPSEALKLGVIAPAGWQWVKPITATDIKIAEAVEASTGTPAIEVLVDSYGEIAPPVAPPVDAPVMTIEKAKALLGSLGLDSWRIKGAQEARETFEARVIATAQTWETSGHQYVDFGGIAPSPSVEKASRWYADEKVTIRYRLGNPTHKEPSQGYPGWLSLGPSVEALIYEMGYGPGDAIPSDIRAKAKEGVRLYYKYLIYYGVLV